MTTKTPTKIEFKRLKDMYSFNFFLYSAFYKIYAFQFLQLVGKFISVRLILFNDFMKDECPSKEQVCNTK